jgi:hypothetical protein
MRKESLEQRIHDLQEEIDEAVAAGRSGEAEELYMELEEISRDEN